MTNTFLHFDFFIPTYATYVELRQGLTEPSLWIIGRLIYHRKFQCENFYENLHI